VQTFLAVAPVYADNTRMDEKPRRRWFRYRLSALFAATALVAICLGVWQPWNPKPSIENRSLIVTGMKGREVIRLLGEPVSSRQYPVIQLLGEPGGRERYGPRMEHYYYDVPGFRAGFAVILDDGVVCHIQHEGFPK
jgi:hypothetical protein